jgi:hypothetical protein
MLVLNLTYDNGLIIPARDSVREVTIQEAVAGIREAGMVSLLEATSDQDNWVQRVKKFFKLIIDRVIGFFKRWFRKIEAYRNERTKEVMKLKGNILRYSNEDDSALMPLNLLNPKPIDSDTMYKYLVTDLRAIIEGVVDGKPVRMSKVHSGGVQTVSEITDQFYEEILGYTKHSQARGIIQQYIYGPIQEIKLNTLDKQKLLDAYLKMDKEFDMIKKMQTDTNAYLTKVLSQIENMAALDRREDVIRYIASAQKAMISVTEEFMTISMTIYNIMYRILMHMGKSSGGSSNGGSQK